MYRRIKFSPQRIKNMKSKTWDSFLLRRKVVIKNNYKTIFGPFFFFQMKYNYKASSPRRLRWTLKAQFRIPFVIFFFLFMDYHLFSVSWNTGCRKKSFLYLLKTLSSSFISSWIYSCQVLWNMFLIIHDIINYRQCKLK